MLLRLCRYTLKNIFAISQNCKEKNRVFVFHMLCTTASGRWGQGEAARRDAPGLFTVVGSTVPTDNRTGRKPAVDKLPRLSVLISSDAQAKNIAVFVRLDASNKKSIKIFFICQLVYLMAVFLNLINTGNTVLKEKSGSLNSVM